MRVREGAAPVRFFRRALQAREVRGMLRRARDAMGLERLRVVRVDGELFMTTVALRLARARAHVLVHEFAVLDLHCRADGHERETLGRVPRRVDVARARSLEVVVVLLTVHRLSSGLQTRPHQVAAARRAFHVSRAPLGHQRTVFEDHPHYTTPS